MFCSVFKVGSQQKQSVQDVERSATQSSRADAKIKDKIEDAEEREHNAKVSLKEVEATYNQHESDIDSMKKRISLLQKELDEKRVLLEERKIKSEEFEEKCVQESEVVRTLESVEIDEDERTTPD